VTLAVLLPALDALLEATRETERQRILGPLERELERDLMRAFREQERRFLRLFATLKDRWPHQELTEAIEPRDYEPLLTLAELRTLRLFEQPLNAIARRALQHGARAAIADVGLGLSFDLAHPEAVAYLQRAPLRIAGINETTREEVRRIIINATEQGWSYDRTARALQEKFASFRTPVPQQHIRSRAHMIAVTETGDAYAQGSLIVGHDLKRAGLRMEKMWLDTEDQRECPICRSNAAEGWIPLDQAFSSGHDAPTAHPACRCDVTQRAVLG
jgi:SPP1 gp7 family putative phage head morphogenesis protein